MRERGHAVLSALHDQHRCAHVPHMAKVREAVNGRIWTRVITRKALTKPLSTTSPTIGSRQLHRRPRPYRSAVQDDPLRRDAELARGPAVHRLKVERGARGRGLAAGAELGAAVVVRED
jgi:hypothetical protein